MIYAFDLDDTLCFQWNDKKDYALSSPYEERIKKVNKLYDDGHKIIVYTARGMGRFYGNVERAKEEHYTMTLYQLYAWGLKFHELIFGKISYDVFIDDKAGNTEDFFDDVDHPCKYGFIAGAFDVMHPGYIAMFQEALEHCDTLFVAIHETPQVNGKAVPILSLEERQEMISMIKGVVPGIPNTYKTEKELVALLKHLKPDVRFLGDDYKGKPYTGQELDIPIVYLDRSHGWSASKYKHMIYLAEMTRKQDDAIASIWAENLQKTIDKEMIDRISKNPEQFFKEANLYV